MNKQTYIPRYRSLAPPTAPAGPFGLPVVEIKAVLRAVRRHVISAAVVFVVVFGLMIAYTISLTPKYSATTRIVVETQDRSTIDIGSALSGLPPNTAIIDTELQVIKSQALLRKVADKLNLTDYPEFNPSLRPTPPFLVTLPARAKSFVKGVLSGGPPVLEDAGSGEAIDPALAELNIAANIMDTKINVDRIGPTYAIDVTATSESPQLAARIANTVADEYLVEQLEGKLETTQRKTAWLTDNLESLRQEVNDKENAVETYRTQSGLLSAQGSTLTEQQIADLNALRSTRADELRGAEARLRAVRARIDAGAGADTMAEVLDSGVIMSLRSQQAEVQRRRAELVTTKGPRWPEVQQVESELADLTSQIDAEINRIVSNLENEVQIARQRVASVDRSLDEIRSTLAVNNRATVRLRELEREAEAARIVYENFLEEFKESDSESDLARADARIIASASAPKEPSSPSYALNLVLAVFLGGAMAGGAILVMELRENHFSSAQQIEQSLNMPCIGLVPLLSGLQSFGRGKQSPADYVIDNPLSAFAEAVRNLRASIIFSDLDNPAKTVSVCSSLPNEGKTTVTFALGRMSALSGSKTLVIDGDFRRRQLTEIAELAPQAGLIEHLFGEVALENVIHVDEPSGLHVLPLSGSRNMPRDVFGSRAFDLLMNKLRDDYDLIIIDTGPLLLMAETRVIVGKTDQTILIARWRSTTRQAMNQSLSLLNQFRANVAGVVLNQVDIRKKRLMDEDSKSYAAYKKYYMEGAA